VAFKKEIQLWFPNLILSLYIELFRGEFVYLTNNYRLKKALNLFFSTFAVKIVTI